MDNFGDVGVSHYIMYYRVQQIKENILKDIQKNNFLNTKDTNL